MTISNDFFPPFFCCFTSWYYLTLLILPWFRWPRSLLVLLFPCVLHFGGILLYCLHFFGALFSYIYQGAVLIHLIYFLPLLSFLWKSLHHYFNDSRVFIMRSNLCLNYFLHSSLLECFIDTLKTQQVPKFIISTIPFPPRSVPHCVCISIHLMVPLSF